MAVMTYTEQLESVQAAIAAIEAGAQSYQIETGIGTGRKVTKADIQSLYAREERLRPKAAREARGGVKIVYGTPT